MKHFVIYITITILTLGRGYSQGNEEDLIDSLYIIENLRATIPYEREYGTANLVIHLIDGNRNITRPLIVAEGFDIGSAISPELKYGSFNYLDFRRFLRGGGEPLRNLIRTDSLKTYDIIYVDWVDGVDYMEKNAYALEAVIEWVNANKITTEKNVVLGQSMGGVVARYALADMEKRGKNHDTRLFISHDAPHQGANMPIGYQYLYRHGGELYAQTSGFAGYIGDRVLPYFNNGVGVSDYLSLLELPAGQQLLKNIVNRNYQIDNTEHDKFYDYLKQYAGLPGSGGYPTQCRNVAISNGSECGDRQDDFVAGDPLLDFQWTRSLSYGKDVAVGLLARALGLPNSNWSRSLAIGSSRYEIGIKANSLAYSPQEPIYKGKIVYRKNLLFFIKLPPITLVDKQINQPAGMLPYDNYGGGFQFIPVDEAAINAVITEYVGEPLVLDIRNTFNFIPTTSALDIGENNISLLDEDYLNAYISGQPPVGLKNTPFANFVTEFDAANPNTHNRRHISFSERNGDWLAAELEETNITFPDCAYVCEPIDIVGSDILCSSDETYTLATSNAVGWVIIAGNTLVTKVDNGNSTTLTSTNSGSGWVTLAARVIASADCGGGGTFTKDIWVGKPSIELEEVPLTNFVQVNLVGANGTDIFAQGITSTTWEEVFSDGDCYVGFEGTEFSGLGEGNCCDWFARIKVTATNDCGTTTVYARIQPSTDTCDATYLRFSQNPMKEGDSNNKITVYTGVNSLPNQDYTITIHTQYAELVYSKTQKETEFNISHLKKGFYIARFQTNNGNIISEKFIIED